MKIKNKNLLQYVLEQLKVKYTNLYVDKLYDKQPSPNTLFGMSKMLSEYNIRIRTIKMNDKGQLRSLKAPFLVHLDGNPTLINKLTDEKVYCIQGNQNVEIPIEEFKNIWDGIVLIPEKQENSHEPEYKENLAKQLFKRISEKLLLGCIAILLIIGFITNSHHPHTGLLLLLISNLAGGYIGYLLIQKQLYIPNNYANKICSLIRKGGCDDVLESPAAKFLGVIGWSEIGLSYFISNIFITLFFPHFITYLAIINMCALPYSLWSVWYQRFKAKQWCPLCLIVQILLWIVFIINIIFHFISTPQFMIIDILFVTIIYILPFLIISFFLPKFISERRLPFMRKEMNDLRLKPEVFRALLKQQPHHPVEILSSQILWGNKDANMLISIVTNPHCPPCAMVHKDIEKLLDNAGNDICVQYIFSAYNEGLESSNKFLISAFLFENNEYTRKEIFNKWFEQGKNDKENFFSRYGFDINSPIVETEMNKHKEWKTQNDNIQGTPTILINGYELPRYYRIEDIIYFTGLKI